MRRHEPLIHQTVDLSVTIMDEMNYLMALMQLGVSNEDPFQDVAKKYDFIASKVDEIDYSKLINDENENQVQELKQQCQDKLV